jgi:hypothetical protein
MKMRANYQPIMMRTLLLSGGSVSKDSISSQIRELNPEKPKEDFRNVPVYGVLEEQHGIVKRNLNNEFVLNIKEELTSEELQQLIALCNWSIDTLELQMEELISAFDKNKNLFDPDRV